MFKTILFATNASEACDAAAKTAFELADKYDAALTLVHVCHQNASTARVEEDAFKSQSDYDHLDGERRIKLKNTIKGMYAHLAQKHREPTLELLLGKPWSKILEYAEHINADCVILGGHVRQGNPSTERFRGFVGSTIQAVTYGALCPVFVVSRPCETCFWYFNQIVFGADFSAESIKAFEFAYESAKLMGCRLHLFHALNIETSQAGVGPGQMSIENRIKSAKENIHDMYVSRMNNFDNYEICVWEGVPYVELLKFSREIRADLIVMARHTGEQQNDTPSVGSTVEQVILRSACPVVSVNVPDPF